MEGLLIWIAIVVGWAIFKGLFSAGHAAVSRQSVKSKVGAFAFKAEVKDLEMESSSCSAIHFSVKGLVDVPRPCYGIVQLFAEDGSLVQALHHDFQEWDTHYFEHVIPGCVFTKDTYFDNWAMFSACPVFMVSPPTGGTQTIQAKLHLISGSELPKFKNGILVQGDTNHQTLRSSVVIQFSNGAGYRDAEENNREVAKATIRLGMAMAISDGSIDSLESAALRGWAKKHVATSSSPVAEKKIINQCLATAAQDAAAGTLGIDSCLVKLNDIGSENSLLSAAELCAEILGADGEVDRREIEMFNKILSQINISEEQGRLFLERQIAAGSVKVSDSRDNAYEILGLTKSMSTAEVRQKLTQEFRKWNGRAGHSDAKLRSQAEKMLLLIGKARSELLVDSR